MSMIDLTDYLQRLECIRKDMLVSRSELCGQVGINFVTYWRLRQMVLNKNPIHMSARTAKKIHIYVTQHEEKNERRNTLLSK